MALLRSSRTPETTWDWPGTFPSWGWFDDLFRDGRGRQMMRVEEYTEDGTLVVRAELPDIDPEKDVELTVANGMLQISAQRTEKKEKEGRRFHRQELRYGSFARSIPLPEGADETSVAASYKDGILEVRVPMPAEGGESEARKIPVSRA